MRIGKVGIALNINWFFPGSDQIADADAAERALQFMGGWFANPIFGSGDYPSIMKLKVYSYKDILDYRTYNSFINRSERKALSKDLINLGCRNSLPSKSYWLKAVRISLELIITRVC